MITVGFKIRHYDLDVMFPITIEFGERVGGVNLSVAAHECVALFGDPLRNRFVVPLASAN